MFEVGDAVEVNLGYRTLGSDNWVPGVIEPLAANQRHSLHPIGVRLEDGGLFGTVEDAVRAAP